MNQEILEKLDRIESAVIAQKSVLNFQEFCKYVGISTSHGYKLTSQRAVPHSCPHGKTLYFDRAEIDSWLLQNPIKTARQLEAEVQKGGQRA